MFFEIQPKGWPKFLQLAVEYYGVGKVGCTLVAQRSGMLYESEGFEKRVFWRCGFCVCGLSCCSM